LPKGEQGEHDRFMQKKLGGSRMERNSQWKNFLLLIVGSLLALHLNVGQAYDEGSFDDSFYEEKTDGCILEEQDFF
jgi:hypothetical protein